MRVEMSLGRLSLNSWALATLVGGLCLFLPLSGCGPTDTTTGTGGANQGAVTDEGHEHNHGGHDHDHEGHDHEGHDHEGHDHEGHDHESASLPESTEKLEAVYAAISKGFADGDPESVHHELHDVGHLLEAIESKVKAGDGVAEGKKESAEEAVAALFEGFSTLDGSLHGNEEADIDGAKTKIADGLKQLKESLK